jgi:hypothetical protein
MAQQAFDHELRARHNRAASMAPTRIDEIDRHRGADIDHANRVPRHQVMCANYSNKPVDTELPRLCIHGRNAA